MRKKSRLLAIVLALAMSICCLSLVACDDEVENKYFDKTTVFHVDLSMSTALGPLSTVCQPGTITFRSDGSATFDVPFTESALLMMDTLLNYRIPTFKHEDTYELNSEHTVITYNSTRKGFEEPITLEIEALENGGMKFVFDIGAQIPDTVLYFYSDKSQMPEQPKTDDPAPVEKIEVEYKVNVDELKAIDDDSAPPQGESFTAAKAITLPDLQYTKDGTIFRGWVVDGETFDPDGNKVYKPGDKFYASSSVSFVPFFDEYINVTFKDPAGFSYTSRFPYGTNMGIPQCFFSSSTTGQGFAYWLLEGSTTKYYPGESRLMSFGTKKDLVFSAVFTKKVKIAFVPGSAGRGAPVVVEAPVDSKIVLEDFGFTSRDDSKGFAGWKVNGTGSVKKVGTKYTVAEGDMIEAAYDALITITLKADENSTGDNVITEQLVKGVSYYAPFNPFEKKDHTFTHWELGTSNTKYLPGKSVSVSKDSVFVAQWKENVTISFNTGVDGSTVKPIVQNNNTKAKLPDVGCTVTGKKFGGWSDGTDIYQPGDEYTFGDTDVTLNAVWLEGMTVNFAGGEGATGEVVSIPGFETDSITLPANGFAKEGMLFGGWSDGTATYQPGDKYTLPKKTNEITSVTLTAVWVAGQYAPYTAVFGVEQNVIAVKGSLMLNSIMAMTQLRVYPDKTADFVVQFVSDQYLPGHAATLGTTSQALRALEKNYEKIPYDYSSDTSTLTLTPADGEPIVLTLRKEAKNVEAGRLYDQVCFDWTFNVGDLTKITFAAIDGEPKYLSEPAVFEAKGIKVSFFTLDLTLRINTDGTGVLETNSNTVGNLTFNHMFADDYNAVIWIGDNGAFVHGSMTTGGDGKRIISVSLLGNTVNLTEVKA